MVFQDGHTYVDEQGQFRATVVMDNLIHQGDIPVMIGIFIDPGHTSDELPEKPGWRPRPANRSFEYDTLSDQYARMLLKEILPEVAKDYHLTDDAEQRAICGISSGGICAWTVAWERPAAFRKVLTHVGSFVNIRARTRVPCAHPQDRTQADSRVPSSGSQRLGQPTRELAPREPTDGRLFEVRRV